MHWVLGIGNIAVSKVIKKKKQKNTLEEFALDQSSDPNTLDRSCCCVLGRFQCHGGEQSRGRDGVCYWEGRLKPRQVELCVMAAMLPKVGESARCFSEDQFLPKETNTQL
jgi:hypothetical protein